MVKELGVTPIARMVSYAAAGVPPRIMGIGPVAAIPKALKQAGMKQEDIELIELNEAFASQSLAVIRTLGLNSDIINVNGGAIALGHPLGCTGAKLSVQLFDEMKKRHVKPLLCFGHGISNNDVVDAFFIQLRDAVHEVGNRFCGQFIWTLKAEKSPWCFSNGGAICPYDISCFHN